VVREVDDHPCPQRRSRRNEKSINLGPSNGRRQQERSHFERLFLRQPLAGAGEINRLDPEGFVVRLPESRCNLRREEIVIAGPEYGDGGGTRELIAGGHHSPAEVRNDPHQQSGAAFGQDASTAARSSPVSGPARSSQSRSGGRRSDSPIYLLALEDSRS